MPMMSMELSLAARRRTSSWRWPSASVGSVFSAILYLPPEACEQTCAACANDPDGSGKMYQLSVGGPLEPPQPAINACYQSSGKACEPSLTKRSHGTPEFSFLAGQATRLSGKSQTSDRVCARSEVRTLVGRGRSSRRGRG